MSRQVSWSEVYERLSDAPAGRLYGIPRGGAIVAGLTGRAVDRLEEADWVVDDVVDSGQTAADRALGKPVWALFDRRRDGLGDRQIVFPWDDRAASRRQTLERLGSELLITLGYEPNAPALADTPTRWARWWEEFIDFDAGRIDTAFDEAIVGQLVVVGGFDLWSMCEHHLLPFQLEVHVAYIPAGKVLGLSKFVRLAHRQAHQLQLQERLTEQLCDLVVNLASTPDVAVLARGRHLCMEARGVRTPAITSSLVGHGRLQEGHLQAAFLAMAGQRLTPDRQRSGTSASDSVL